MLREDRDRLIQVMTGGQDESPVFLTENHFAGHKITHHRVLKDTVADKRFTLSA